MAGAGATPTYAFGGFRLDTRRRLLLSAHGDSTPLASKTFETLRYLVEHPARLLDKRELLDAIWPNVAVEENNLNQAISTLRRLLGERPGEHAFIVTEPGRGYRFVARVDVLSDEPAAPTDLERTDAAARAERAGSRALKSKRAVLAVFVSVAIVVSVLGWRSLLRDSVAQPRSLAVLPLENLSPEPSSAAFVAGIHDEILTRLAQIEDLSVKSRTTMTRYAGSSLSIPEIARELEVDAVLQGTVRISDDRVRLSVQLVAGGTDEHLWIQTYQRTYTAENMFDIQRNLAVSVAEQLQASVSADEAARLAAVPTKDTRAYDFYLSGKEYEFGSDFRADLPLAVAQFQRAVKQDPEFALAWAHLSTAHISMYWFGIDRTDARRDAALSAAGRSLTIAPDLPEAHLAMAWYHYQGFRDYRAALASLAAAERRALETDQTTLLRAFIDRREGRLAEALAGMDRVIERDPKNVALLWEQALTYQTLREYDAAERYLDLGLEIEPDAQDLLVTKAWIPAFRQGDVASLKAAANNALIDRDTRLGLGLAAAIRERDYDSALAYAAATESDLITSLNGGQWSEYIPKASVLGVLYRLGGRPDLALPQLLAARNEVEEALQQHPNDASVLMALAEIQAGLGEQESAIRLATDAIALLPRSKDAVTGSLMQLDAALRVFAPIGAVRLTVASLDDFLANPGYWSVEGLLPDPRLDPVRNDASFSALVAKYRQPRP